MIGAIAGLLQTALSFLLEKIWAQLLLEDTTLEIEGTLDSIEIVDDADLNDLLLSDFGMSDANASGLPEGDALT